MKTSLILLPALCLFELPLMAQVKVVAQPCEVTPSTAARLLGPLAAQRQLLIVPKVEAKPAPVPGRVVKATKTTTTVETPGLPTRVYHSERNVVMVENQNQN